MIPQAKLEAKAGVRRTRRLTEGEEDSELGAGERDFAAADVDLNGMLSPHEAFFVAQMHSQVESILFRVSRCAFMNRGKKAARDNQYSFSFYHRRTLCGRSEDEFMAAARDKGFLDDEAVF